MHAVTLMEFCSGFVMKSVSLSNIYGFVLHSALEAVCVNDFLVLDKLLSIISISFSFS